MIIHQCSANIQVLWILGAAVNVS